MRMQDLSFLELLMIASIFAVYFLPSLIAFAREHKNKLAIFLLNLLLGWTVFGWVSSLVWSVVR